MDANSQLHIAQVPMIRTDDPHAPESRNPAFRGMTVSHRIPCMLHGFPWANRHRVLGIALVLRVHQMHCSHLHASDRSELPIAPLGNVPGAFF